jgi:hypothetical protein
MSKLISSISDLQNQAVTVPQRVGFFERWAEPRFYDQSSEVDS